MRPPILIIHICAGVVGVLSGAAAMSFRKGSRPHRVGGNLFFVAMLVMGSSAAYLGNVVGGLFACYLVATACSLADGLDFVAFRGRRKPEMRGAGQRSSGVHLEMKAAVNRHVPH